MPSWLLLLLLLMVFLALVSRGRTRAAFYRRHRSDPDDIDEDVLDQAEREVSELDSTTSPEEADDHLPDWGPGAPPPPAPPR